MKRFSVLSMIAAALLLTACGETNTQTVDNIAAQQSSPSEEASSFKMPEVSVASSAHGEYDVDLTVLDSNMIYAQVYDMIFGETDYTGQNVRAKGRFNYYLDPDTKNEYFAVLISDASACCAQGIEFVLAGDYAYPKDYPEPGTEIVVHGIFNTYEDDTGTYVQLKDAVMEYA